MAKQILYIFPRIVDTVLQNTTENEIARSLTKLGNTITTIVAYKDTMTELDGFTRTIYVKNPGIKILNVLKYHTVLLWHMAFMRSDVVLVNFPAMHLVPIAVVLQKLLFRKTLFVMDIRSVPVDVAAGIRGKILNFRYRLGLTLANYFCDGMTVITPALRDTILDKVPRLKGNIGIWESGVNLSHFENSQSSEQSELAKQLGLDSKKVLIYHGVMSPNRGLQSIISAISLLVEQYPDLRMLFVGDGPGKEELVSMTAELSLQEVVVFVDSVPYIEISKYISLADAGILPFPNIEWWAVSSPIKLMEYMAMGLPVIATDITAIRHVVDQTSGAILSVDDSPDELAKAIKTFLEEGCIPADHSILEETISWNKQADNLDKYVGALM